MQARSGQQAEDDPGAWAVGSWPSLQVPCIPGAKSDSKLRGFLPPAGSQVRPSCAILVQDDLSAEFGPSQLGVLPFTVTAEVGLARGDHFEQTERAGSFQGIEMSARNVIAHHNAQKQKSRQHSPAHHDDEKSLDNHQHYENKSVAHTGYGESLCAVPSCHGARACALWLWGLLPVPGGCF